MCGAIQACQSIETSDARHDGTTVQWRVEVTLSGGVITRKAWRGDQSLAKVRSGWEPEGVIWPTWPGRAKDEISTSEMPLAAVEEYWNAAGKRLRDSAKWMATVLGAALAAIAGTSPLSDMRRLVHQPGAFLTGAVGLVFLFVTLFLVIQVMRPQSVSLADVQHAHSKRRGWQRIFHGNALYNWRSVIEKEPDLHFPCGIRTLDALRQSMIIEEVTLLALSQATTDARDEPQTQQALCDAQEARAVRLLELRTAASKIATVGEYYKLLFRSSWATYGGVLFGLLGTTGVVAAFVWP